MAEMLVDQTRVAMFQALSQLGQDGFHKVTRWTWEDGLPFDTAHPAHHHTMPTVAIGLVGVTRVTGRTTIDLAPGHVLVVEPGCWHRHEPQRPGSYSFGMGFLASYCDTLFFTESEVLWGAIPKDPMRSIVDRLVDAPNESVLLDTADDLLKQLLAERIRFLDWCHPDVLSMAAHLWNHLHQQIHVEDMLRQAGHRRSTGFSLFKKFFGRSPRQELIAQRLDLARHLLRRGLSVSESAARSGFRDRSDFTRAHRLHFGVPPTA